MAIMSRMTTPTAEPDVFEVEANGWTVRQTMAVDGPDWMLVATRPKGDGIERHHAPARTHPFALAEAERFAATLPA